MFTRLLGLLILLGIASIGWTQQTANYLNNWHFGDGAGVSFNSGSPVLVPSSVDGFEVTINQSDGDGNLLFYGFASQFGPYTNGAVFDASHTMMPNGDVSIDFSSSSGLATAPAPGSCDQHYVFAMKSTGPGWGLHYSIVDMSLPGNGTVPIPLGDVVPGQKDIVVYGGDNLCEKITVVQKGNSEDYWVIVRSSTADVFYSFEVTSAGVNSTPVTSVISAATYANVGVSPMLGWLAVNPSRDLIAETQALVATDMTVLYNFDNLTGVLSLAESLQSGALGLDLTYGCEFSPDGNILYTTSTLSGDAYISRFDITAGVGSIGATRVDELTAAASIGYGGINKSPDGKLYAAQSANIGFLAVINDPNDFVTPNIVGSGYSLAPSTGVIGLPNLSYYFHPDNYIDTLAGNDRTICENDIATIGAIGYDSIECNYSWAPAGMVENPSYAITQTVPLAADQEFILTTITSCGDTIKVDTVMVTLNALNANVATSSPICEGDGLTLNATPTGLGSGNYAWVGPMGTFGGAGLSNVTIMPFPNPIPGGWYYCTVTDGNCSDTDSAFVVSNPTYNITDDVSVCENVLYTYPDGTQSTITANESHVSSLTTVAGCDSIVTTNVTMVVAYTFTENVTACENELYTYPDGTISTITANESHVSNLLSTGGCDSIITTNVAMVLPYSNTIPVSVCNGDDYTYADGTVSINITSNESYTSTFTSIAGCDSLIIEEITITGPVAPTAGTTATYCEGDPLNDLTATAGAGGILTWYSDPGLTNVLGTGTILTPSNTTGIITYHVTETVGACESPAATVEITINPIPPAPLSPQDVIGCEDDIFGDLTATPTLGGTLTWYSDAGLTNIIGTGPTLPITPVLGTTTYYVTESQGACEGPAGSVDITVHPNPIANAGPDATIMLGDEITLSGSGGTSYTWNPSDNLSCVNCQNPVASPVTNTTYTLTVSNDEGCTGQADVTITVIQVESDLFIPNVFSPNGDQNNDAFVVEGTGLNDFNLKVYNRWGQLVFESTDQQISWDGTQNGEELNTAVFAYVLTFTNNTGTEQVRSGNVTLIK